MVYIVSSRPTRAIKRDLVSKQSKNKTKNKLKKKKQKQANKCRQGQHQAQLVNVLCYAGLATPSASRSSRQSCPPMPFHLRRQQLSGKIVTQTLLRLVVHACIPEPEAEAGKLRVSKPGSHGETVWEASTLVFRVHHNFFSMSEH